MPHKAIDPPQNVIKEWLRYDPETGIFIWIKDPVPHAPRLLGKEAGCISPAGYRHIGMKGYRQRTASRMAWIYCNGDIPEFMEIDHINGKPSDDRLVNLRLATSSQQKQNRSCQNNNQSGLRGALFHACHKGKKWRSQIKVGSKLIFLGYFATPEEASAAHSRAAKRYFGEFSNDRVAFNAEY